jgi:uncharacterized protein (TIGR00288 family)
MPSHLRPALTRAEPPVHSPNAALLIDFDNVTLGVRSEFTKELRTLLNSDIIKGKVAVQRAYADWRRYPQYIVPLSESSIDLIFAPAFGSVKKNATDIRLAIDAIELVFTRPEIGTFILLSGDSDFSMLVIKLKEYGKYVIGVGIRESASDILIQNCDEYFSYSDLAGLTKEPDTPSAQRDPWELVKEAAAQMVKNGDVMRSDRLKQVMQQIDSNFDERNAGFNRFSKFVTEAGSKGLIKVTKLDNGQYEIAPTAEAVGATPSAPAREGSRSGRTESRPGEPKGEAVRTEGEGRRGGRGRRGRGGRGRDRERTEEGSTPSSEAAAPRHETRHEGAGGLSLARAFNLMREALAQLGTSVGHEALRLRMAAIHGKDDSMLTADKFARLLRQANDAEVADVRKIGEDDFEVSLHPTEDPRARAGAGFAMRQAAAPAPTNGTEPESTDAPVEAAPVLRYGVRSRPGTRPSMRPSGLQLVGAVSLDDEVPAAAPVAEAAPVKKGRAPAKKAEKAPKGEKAVKASKAAPKEAATGAATKPARPRARAAKKAE